MVSGEANLSQFSYLVTGATDNRREDGTGSIVSGETGFAHAGAVVADQGSYIFVVTHFGCCCGCCC